MILRHKFSQGGVMEEIVATHAIKIGFDARSKRPPDKQKYPFPGKLPGFLLTWLSRSGTDSNLIPDYDAMKALGVSTEQIEEARKVELKGVGKGLLPDVLHFYLPGNATVGPNGWEYPQMCSTEYVCHDGKGRFCSGNGVEAWRRQHDGTKARIQCVPAGAEGTAACDWCKESVDKLCAGTCELCVGVFTIGKDGRPLAVNPQLRDSARYLLRIRSRGGLLRIAKALDRAADRVDGNLKFITGTLHFSLRTKRTGESTAPLSLTPQVYMQLSEADLMDREKQVHGRFLNGPTLTPLAIGNGTKPEVAQTASPDQANMPQEPDGDEVDDEPFGVQNDAEAIAQEIVGDPVTGVGISGFTAKESYPVDPAGESCPQEQPSDADESVTEPTDESAAPTTAPATQVGPVHKTIAECEDEELATAMSDYVKQNELNWTDLAGIRVMDKSTRKLKSVPVSDVAWFFQGVTPEKDQARRKHLRKICEDVLERDFLFSEFLPLAAPVAQEAAK